MTLKHVVVAGIALACTAPAFAFVPWTNPAGSNSVLSWSGGGSDNGLFGSPTVVADTFFFIANQNFIAQASDGSSQITEDTLRVRVNAINGNAFSEVIFFSSGDYTLFGSGASVNITGNMSVSEVGGLGRNASSPFVTTPGMPLTGNDAGFTQGNWSGFSLIDFASFGIPLVTSIDLVFTNRMVAITLPGSTAAIATLPNTQGAFSLQIIPAPGAVALLGMGGLLLARRRR